MRRTGENGEGEKMEKGKNRRRKIVGRGGKEGGGERKEEREGRREKEKRKKGRGGGGRKMRVKCARRSVKERGREEREREREPCFTYRGDLEGIVSTPVVNIMSEAGYEESKELQVL